MTNNTKNKNTTADLQSAINNLLGNNTEMGDEIKKFINSLSEDDVKKISGLMKNNDLKKIANSIIDSKKQKE